MMEKRVILSIRCKKPDQNRCFWVILGRFYESIIFRILWECMRVVFAWTTMNSKRPTVGPLPCVGRPYLGSEGFGSEGLFERDFEISKKNLHPAHVPYGGMFLEVKNPKNRTPKVVFHPNTIFKSHYFVTYKPHLSLTDFWKRCIYYYKLMTFQNRVWV